MFWGIVLMLQWGRNFIVAEIINRPNALRLGEGPLQWGRNFIVAEIGTAGRRAVSAPTASMGPQLYRCGNAPGYLEDSLKPYCFNGATTLSLWK